MSGPGKIARAYFTEGDKMLGIVMEYLHNQAKVSGATVLRGYAGFGKSGVMHSMNIPQEAVNLPIIVEFIDEASKVDAVIQHFKEMFSPGHIISWPVQMD